MSVTLTRLQLKATICKSLVFLSVLLLFIPPIAVVNYFKTSVPRSHNVKREIFNGSDSSSESSAEVEVNSATYYQPQSLNKLQTKCTSLLTALEVSNLTITADSNNFTAKLSWTPPEDCEGVSYQIYRDGTAIVEKVTEAEYQFEDLDACSSYILGVAVIYEEILGEIVDYTLTTSAPDPFGYSVENLQTSLVDETSMNVSWAPPIESKIQNCIADYKIEWWDKDGVYTTKENTTMETSFIISPLTGCMTYTIQVFPQVNLAIEGLTASVDRSIEGKVTNPPTFVSATDLDQTSFNLIWNADSELINKCEIVNMIVQCEAPKDQNGNFSWIKFDVPKKIQDATDYLHSAPRFITLIDDLSPFTNYTCLGLVENSVGISEASNSVNLRTAEDVPSQPEPVTVYDVTSESFAFNWSVPYKVPGILSNYLYFVENKGPNHFVQEDCLKIENFNDTVAPDIYSNLFSEGFPNFNYTVTVWGVDGAGEGEKASSEVTTLVGVPEKPNNLTKENADIEQSDDYKAAEEISWELPCNTNGPFSHFKLDIKGEYVEEGVSFRSGEEDARTETVSRNENIEDIFYSYNITDIKASYQYFVHVSAINEDGAEGESDVLNFTSPDGYPGAPFLEPLDNATSDQFWAYWNEPLVKNGKILHYNVTVRSGGPAYPMPINDSSCTVNAGTWVEQVQGDLRSYTFSGAEAYYLYFAFVTAETSAGYGTQSEERNITTSPAAPEPIRNHTMQDNYSITDQEYRGWISGSFNPPCHLRGPFSRYQIRYTGQRDNFPNHTGTNSSQSTSYTIDLMPDYDYTIYIDVVTQNFTTTSPSYQLHSKPGVPGVVETVVLEPPTSNTTTTAYFRFPRGVFDENNGHVQYYSLIVFPNIENFTEVDYGLWSGDVEDWPGAPINASEITPELWNPFEGNNTSSDFIDFVIGIDENCSNSSSCNPPLQANAEYLLIVRALTSATYRDSKPLKFKTLQSGIVNGDKGWIIGLVIGIIIVAIIIIIFIIILWRRKNKRKLTEEDFRKSESSPLPVDCKKFPAHYDYLELNYNIVKAQYTLLGTKTKDVNYPSTFAILTENRRKNRYTNILPYDDTRVKLQMVEDDEISSDYINASFIKGYSGKVEYIATQGPLESTTKDFWRMIVQENVSLIVMVSQFVEQSKEKCYQYFPNNHQKIIFDDYEVRCCTELHFGTYCIRTLQVQKDVIQRNVIHMQYLEWPDFGVPSGTENVLQFCYQIRERAKGEDGLIVVHCSAGVGRTGTIIATDILLQTIEDHRDINIFKVVMDLRRQRTNMVQTEKQYMFIHTCIRDALETPPTPTSTKDKEPLYENLDVLKSEIKPIGDTLVETESAL